MNHAPVTIITGASSGIGAATAELLAAKGHRLLLIARRAERLEAVAERLSGGEVATLAGDVADPALGERAVAMALERWGVLDNLVNNAGYGAYGRFEELADEQWNRLWEVNVMGVVRFSRAALPPMAQAGRGTIVNVSSVSGFLVYPTGSAYCASKHALEGMTGCLREEAREQGIRVSLVCPGSVSSGFWTASDGRFMGEERTGREEWMISPEQIARAIATAIECEDHSLVAKIEVRPLRKGPGPKKG